MMEHTFNYMFSFRTDYLIITFHPEINKTKKANLNTCIQICLPHKKMYACFAGYVYFFTTFLKASFLPFIASFISTIYSC